MTDLHNVLLPVAGALFLAIRAICLRVATREKAVTDIIAIALVINVGVIVPFALTVPADQYRLTGLSIAAFTAAGVVSTVLGRVALYTGIKRVGASRAEPLKSVNPLFAVLVAIPVLGERMVIQHLLGVVFIVAGIVLISWERTGGPTYDDLGTPKDLIFPLLAALFFGIEPIFAKIGLNDGAPFLVGLAIKTLTAATGLFAYLWWRTGLPSVKTASIRSLSWAAAVGVAEVAFLVSLYASLSVAPVVLVQPIIQSSPLFVVVFSFVLLQHREHVNRRLLAGAIVVVIGGVLVTVYG